MYKNLLKALLLGTVLAGSVAVAGMWDNAPKGSADRPNGYNPDMIGMGGTTKQTSTTTPKTTTSAPASRTNYSAGQNVNEQLDMFETTANLRQNNYSGAPGNVWTDGKGNIIGKTGSDGGWFTDNNGQVVHYRIEGTNAVVAPTSNVSSSNSPQVSVQTQTPPPATSGASGSGVPAPDVGVFNADKSGIWNGSGWDPTGNGPVNLSPGDYGASGTFNGSNNNSGAVVSGSGVPAPDVGVFNADKSGIWNGSGWDPTGNGPVNLSPGDYGASGTFNGSNNNSGAVVSGSGAQAAGSNAGATASFKVGEVLPVSPESTGSVTLGANNAVLDAYGNKVGTFNPKTGIANIQGSDYDLNPAPAASGAQAAGSNVGATASFKVGEVLPVSPESTGPVTLGANNAVLDGYGNQVGTYDPKTGIANIQGSDYDLNPASAGSGTPAATDPKVSDVTAAKVQENLANGDDPSTAYAKAMDEANAQASNNDQNAPQTQPSGGESGGKSAIDKIAEKIMDPIAIQNVPQYVLMIMEALEGNNQDDATKEVKVKGADPMNDSQGSPTSGATSAMPNTPMSGTTIVDSANAMITLLNMDKIDLNLLSMDVEKVEKETTAGISAQIATSDGKATKTEQKAPTSNSKSESEELTTTEKREILHRRALLLGEWAAAATQIGEGSNAISSTFYDRAKLFSAVANSAPGSLGGISAITDTDRFVLFEITRGAALSGIQLGLQGAVNLNSLEEVGTSSSDSPDPGISITPGISQ